MANNLPYTAIYSSRAQKELAHSWDWYEERQQGLGDRFVHEIIRHEQLITQNPERYPARHKSYRETPVPVFPYLLIYRVNKKKKLVYIVSVFHTSINPKKKYQ